MEESKKVRHISQQEAREIDATKVAYFTLNDGTVLLVKNEANTESEEIPQENMTGEEQQYQMNSNEEEEALNQNVEEQNAEEVNEQLPEEQELQKNEVVSGQENQEQVQIESQNENQQVFTTSENEQINNVQIQNVNTQDTQQQISNLENNIPSENENIQQNCSCGYNMNAKLINANTIGSTYIQQQFGKRRQLFKLVEAIPVRFNDFQGVQLINQTNNIRLNLQQYNSNTYIVEKSNRNNFSNYQINTQSSGNDYQEKYMGNTYDQKIDYMKNINQQQIEDQKEQEIKCNCKLGQEQDQQMENQDEEENQQEEETKCCCPIGNPKMREELEIVSPEFYEKYMKMKMNKK